MSINRRHALSLLGSGAALGLPASIAAAAASGPVRFDHGVASGDPAADGAILWTRASVAGEGDAALSWHVATSEGGKPVRSGRVTARAARDGTVKAEVGGLKPGTEHWYWFEGANGERSSTGRFRTLPRGSTPDLVLAAVSCQSFPAGMFNAYDAIAKLARVDAVLHLGDYIYEYGQEGFGGEIGRRIGRMVEPAHEILTLADYRARHAQVKRDPDMQAAHARAAFICVWDDHEVANDDWTGGAENHTPATEGDWRARKAAALQAYFEWMPIRDPLPGGQIEAIERSFEFGDLATLAMVETRLLARSKQAEVKGAAPDPSDYAAVLAVREDPSRELLGAAQQRWLERTLAASVRAGKPWQLLGNQVVMARVPGPDLERQLGAEKYAATVAKLPEPYKARIPASIASYRAGLPFNLDSWDGYPPARERLYAAFARAGTRPLVMSGDSHAAWTNNCRDARGRLAAVEVGVTAVTSQSYGSLLPGIGRNLTQAGEEVLFCDQDNKGFSVVTLTPAEARVEYHVVSTVFAKPFEHSVVQRARVAAGREAGWELV